MRLRRIVVRELQSKCMPSRTYGTHKWDKYPAKMLPHLARYAIEKVSEPGAVVLDPFCGCGTVQIESSVTGRRSIGVDVNPVAVCLARAKAMTCDTEKLNERVADVLASARRATNAVIDVPTWLKYWFTEKSLEKLLKLRDAISRADDLSAKYRSVLIASLIVSTRQCSKADPRSPKPFISSTARKNRVGKHFDAFQVYGEVIGRYCSGLSELASVAPKRASVATRLGDARKLTSVVSEPVDAIVTSPPYLSAQDYFRSSKLEMAVAGLDAQLVGLGERMLGSGRGRTPNHPNSNVDWECRQVRQLRTIDPRSAYVVDKYLNDMLLVFHQMFSVLKPGGECCVMVGDSTIRGLLLPVHRWMKRLAIDSGFAVFAHEADQIRDRRVPPKRTGHDSVIDLEHLLFFRKPS